RRDAFRQHGLAGAWRSDHEHAPLALATGAHVVPTLLHQRQDPAHLLDRRLLAADVFDLDLVVGFSRIHVIASDPLVDEECSEEQHEVGDMITRKYASWGIAAAMTPGNASRASS